MEMDQTSQALGKYLLSGWTMTKDACANMQCGVPLMRSREGKVICVHCTMKESDTSTPKTSHPTPATSSLLSDTEVSAEMGRRMLQGWTLMGDVCIQPSCVGIPLVQDKNKQMQCVKCGQRYMHDHHPDAPSASSTLPPTITPSNGPQHDVTIDKTRHALTHAQHAILDRMKDAITDGIHAHHPMSFYEHLQLASNTLTLLEQLKTSYDQPPSKSS